MVDYDKQAIKAALLRINKNDDHNYLCMNHWYYRFFYAFKAIVCLLLDRDKKNKSIFDSWDYIVVTCFGGGNSYIPEEPTQYYWDEFFVGYGIFSNWYFRLEMVST
jgi:hypothetical protein